MTSLDELLDDGAGRGTAAGRGARRGGVRARAWRYLRWALAAALGAALLGGALAAVLYVLGVQLWYPLLPAGVFVVLVLRRAVVGLVAEWPARPVTEQLPDPDPPERDGLVPAVHRWQLRARWDRAGWRTSRALQPYLAELVDERLRQRYGCTRSSEPERVRQLLGERWWRYLSEPGARTPPSRELARMLTTVEEL